MTVWEGDRGESIFQNLASAQIMPLMPRSCNMVVSTAEHEPSHNRKGLLFTDISANMQVALGRYIACASNESALARSTIWSALWSLMKLTSINVAVALALSGCARLRQAGIGHLHPEQRSIFDILIFYGCREHLLDRLISQHLQPAQITPTLITGENVCCGIALSLLHLDRNAGWPEALEQNTWLRSNAAHVLLTSSSLSRCLR